ncbi:MAG: ABC transporter permease [Bdellovibrio sp.]|nr:ABC transporter permease [Methylotenera sp.]
MNAWLYQHAQTLKLVLSRFKTNMLSTLLICLAIGVTVALPSLLYAVLDSANGLVSNVKSESQISVFLALNHDDGLVANISSALNKEDQIKRFKFISKDDALKDLQAADTNKDILNSLEKNPLPDAFLIEPKQLDNASIATLKSILSKLDGVDEVIVNGAWLKRLNALLALGQSALTIVAALLAFAIVAVIGNTIRMQILTQQAEINLSQLIGATKSFIRRPFLYAGALYGLLGGLFALAITAAVITQLNQALAPLVADYQTNFALRLPNFSVSLIICALALLLGVIAAYFAVSKSSSQT